MHTLLKKLDTALTVEYIENRLGFNLRTADPQGLFFHPADALKKIFQLVGRSHTKSERDVGR